MPSRNVQHMCANAQTSDWSKVAFGNHAKWAGEVSGKKYEENDLGLCHGLVVSHHRGSGDF